MHANNRQLSTELPASGWHVCHVAKPVGGGGVAGRGTLRHGLPPGEWLFLLHLITRNAMVIVLRLLCK